MTPNRTLTIALAGNPNAGKTTIFNSLTGTRQKVGNWPGVTVEKKEGRISRNGYDLKIVDLPGTYSLTPFSIEEIIARDFILEGAPDVVIDIIDSSNLERSLYLATQIRELDCKVLFALNMADLAQARGIKIDAAKLSELLNVPVVATVGNKSEGIDALLREAIQLAETDAVIDRKRRVRYSKDIEAAIARLHETLQATDGHLPYNPRWAAVKLLENDAVVRERLAGRLGEKSAAIFETVRQQRKILAGLYDEDPEIVLTDERYGFIAGIIKEVVTTSSRQRIDISRTIDLVLTNRFLGFPIFILFIWGMFQMTFSLGAYPMEWMARGIDLFSVFLASHLPDGLVKGMVIDGIVGGVGSVIIFLPNILILFFCIALFEDTGYMARAAFLMDRIMHLIGLHGKSFIPMLMGFGCNVPAIMAARTLESEKDRLLTILITPFMSCSARLPIYIILAGAFFGPRAGTVIFGIYLLGILVSILTGRLFRSTLLKGADAPFVMELPPYRVPMLRSLLIHMWDRAKMFLKKMGGIILVGSMVVWALSAFPGGSADMPATENSYMARIGQGIAPVFQPLGIDWRGSVALLTGFVAKEIVVSTMGVLYAVDAEAEAEAFKHALQKSGMTPLSALSMMVFVLLYIPCLATVSAIRKESGSLKWTIISVGYSIGVAWFAALSVYQGGRLLGFA